VIRFLTRRRLALFAGLVVFFALIGGGAAEAFWNTLAPITGSSSTTNASVTLSSLNALTTFNSNQASPGQLVITPVTVGNNGGAPLTLALTETSTSTISTLPGKTNLWIWTQVSGSCGASTVGTAGTLAAIPALPSAAVSAAPGSSTVLCFATQLQATAQSNLGGSVTATFTLTGSVGTNWTATATAGFTQTIVPPNVTNVVCSNVLLGTTTTFSPVPGATGYTILSGTTTLSTIPAAGPYSYSMYVLSTSSITIVVNYAGGYSSSGVVQRFAPVLLGILVATCG
jgi:hypothetical protein